MYCTDYIPSVLICICTINKDYYLSVPEMKLLSTGVKLPIVTFYIIMVVYSIDQWKKRLKVNDD